MSYHTAPEVGAYRPEYDLPHHLAHKPVYALPYQHFDGPWAEEGKLDSDVQFLSVGLAQYNSADISVKVMRHTEEKWTRQAEELPPNRVVDMALLTALVMFDAQDGVVRIPAKTFENQEGNSIELRQEEVRDKIEQRNYERAVEEQRRRLLQRFSKLRKVLNTLHEQGRLPDQADEK